MSQHIDASNGSPDDNVGDGCYWWAHEALHNGQKTREEVKAAIVRCCYEDPNSPRSYQMGLFEDSAVWGLFGPNELRALLLEFAPDCADYALRAFPALCQHLGRVSALEIVTVAAPKASSPGAVGMQVLGQLPLPLQKQAAMHLVARADTIPFIVRQLKHDARSGRNAYRAQRDLFFNPADWPLSVPGTVRWAMLGGDEVKAPDGKDSWNDFTSYHEWWKKIRRLAVGYGWQFERVERRDNPLSPNGFDLQVAIRSQGRKVVYIHDQNGERGDMVRAGDEVMVLSNPFQSFIAGGHVHADRKQLEPVFERGNLTIFRLELHPVRPPTPAMLRDPQRFYFGKDILPR